MRGFISIHLGRFIIAMTFGLVSLLFACDAGLAETSYVLSPRVKEAYNLLSSNPAVRKGLDFIKTDQENTLAEQKQICTIPAPPFQEQTRAQDYRKRLAPLGLKDIRMDKEGNVFGLLPGTGKGPRLLVAAHLDTVFDKGTDTSVKERDGKLYAPGISDDSRGLAALLSILRAFQASGIKTTGDILFCGNVGEEGLGDLRGVKALFRDHKDIDGFISLDSAGAEGIIFLGTGSHRYEITYKGPGGHSFSAFGLPSATHALGRAIARIADLKTPQDPKTTFTVGTVRGGTSVNSIAAEASLQMDMRSNSEKELLELEAKFLDIVIGAAAEEPPTMPRSCLMASGIFSGLSPRICWSGLPTGFNSMSLPLGPMPKKSFKPAVLPFILSEMISNPNPLANAWILAGSVPAPMASAITFCAPA